MTDVNGRKDTKFLYLAGNFISLHSNVWHGGLKTMPYWINHQSSDNERFLTDDEIQKYCILKDIGERLYDR